ncbi:MAG: family 78 glycoside hydrolase catalytic domain [Bacteroidales bacterium]|nr:family 78 glycoside hydrolase catalytic domain [Bacteroidales bacterium]
MKRLLTFLSAALLLLSCNRTPDGPFRVTGLQVDYMTAPLGLDTPFPRFSWKMESNHYAQRQAAYRLVVTESGTGETVWDSAADGTLPSDVSVGVVYRGRPLKPCTRYNWTVEVTNAEGETVSAGSWFETGLMDSGWSDARWISGGQPHFSKYRTHFEIETDIQLPAGSGEADFLMGWLDSSNYVRAQLRRDAGKPVLALHHVAAGVDTCDWEKALTGLFPVGDVAWETRLCLRVVSFDYAAGYKIWPSVGGQLLVKEPVVIHLATDREYKPVGRFNKVGFAQPEGSEAVFSNLTVTERVWHTTLYKSDSAYSIQGGQTEIISPAEESGAPMLRKTFRIEKPLAAARLYTTARGIYEYEINGKRMADDWFNPGSTDYRFRFLYNTYDITPLLKKGVNAVCAQLGAGWYSDFTGYATAWQDQFGTELSLLAKIVLTYADGSRETIVSDGSWKAFNGGPIISDSFQNGEDYDARREVKGWSDARFDDSGWTLAQEIEAPADSVIIASYIGSPVQTQSVLKAVAVSEPKPGVFVYDMGQNMVGVPRVRLQGARGKEIVFRYGEMIYPTEVPEDPLPPLTADIYAERKGLVYNDNYRGALATDHYILKGGGAEVFQPRFTFHGFRYIEIHGLDKALPLESVEGLVLHSVGPQTSGFETSDADVNRLYENIVWGQRGNFLSIPTDCPQRDERMGWTGDAQVFARAATYNMNVDPFFSRWFQSVRDIQGEDGSYCDFIPKVGQPPYGSSKGGGALGWMEAGIVIPWQLYLQYGDLQFVREHYASMEHYMDYLQKRTVGDIQPGSGYGDWVALEHTNSPLTNTAYYAYDAMLMEKMAAALGKYADEARWHALYERIKKAFNREFVGPDGVTKESKNVPPYHEWIAGDADASFKANTQTSYVVPLQAELFDEAHKSLALQNLVENVAAHDYTLTTGFIGTPYLNLVLSRAGFDNIAYRLFEQRAYPSWLYPVMQGATTMWERWNSYTIKRGFGPVDMNSFNHYSFGAIEEWMFSYMLGIRPLETDPGYHSIVLEPRVGGSFTYVKGHYDSVYGRIESGWRWTDDGSLQFDFSVPANTTASLTLPLPEDAEVQVTLGSEYAAAGESPGRYELPSGKYRFVIR